MTKPPIKRGWLTKLGYRAKNWRKRYFVLEHGCLTYYTSQAQDSKGKKGSVQISGATIGELSSPEYDLRWGPRTAFTVQGATSTRVFVLVASGEKERAKWIQVLRQAAFFRDRPSPLTTSGGGSRDICWSCGVTGHTSDNCPDNASVEEDGLDDDASVTMTANSQAGQGEAVRSTGRCSVSRASVNRRISQLRNSRKGKGLMPCGSLLSPTTTSRAPSFSESTSEAVPKLSQPPDPLHRPSVAVLPLIDTCLVELVDGLDIFENKTIVVECLQHMATIALDSQSYKNAQLDDDEVSVHDEPSLLNDVFSPKQVHVTLLVFLHTLPAVLKQLNKTMEPAATQDEVAFEVWKQFQRFTEMKPGPALPEPTAGNLSTITEHIRRANEAAQTAKVKVAAEKERKEAEQKQKDEEEENRKREVALEKQERKREAEEQRKAEEEASQVNSEGEGEGDDNDNDNVAEGPAETQGEAEAETQVEGELEGVQAEGEESDSDSEGNASAISGDEATPPQENQDAQVDEVEQTEEVGEAIEGIEEDGVDEGEENDVARDLSDEEDLVEEQLTQEEMVDDFFHFTPALRLPAKIQPTKPSIKAKRTAKSDTESEEALTIPLCERYALNGRMPIVDIQVVVHRNAFKDVPPGYSLLKRSFGNRGANLNKGTAGYHVYLCFKRQTHRDSFREGNSELRPVTAVCLVSLERGDDVPQGFKIITRTVNGEHANLNVATQGPSVYLAICRGEGAPITDIQVRYLDKHKGKVQELPVGWHEASLTPSGNVANLNTGNNGFSAFLCFQLDTSRALRRFKAYSTGLIPSGVNLCKAEGFAKCLGTLTAAFYCHDQQVIVHALMCFKQLKAELIPPTLLNTFVQSLCAAGPCFRTYFTAHSIGFLLETISYLFQTSFTHLSLHSVVQCLQLCFLNLRVDSDTAGTSHVILDVLFAELKRREGKLLTQGPASPPPSSFSPRNEPFSPKKKRSWKKSSLRSARSSHNFSASSILKKITIPSSTPSLSSSLLLSQTVYGMCREIVHGLANNVVYDRTIGKMVGRLLAANSFRRSLRVRTAEVVDTLHWDPRWTPDLAPQFANFNSTPITTATSNHNATTTTNHSDNNATASSSPTQNPNETTDQLTGDNTRIGVAINTAEESDNRGEESKRRTGRAQPRAERRDDTAVRLLLQRNIVAAMLVTLKLTLSRTAGIRRHALHLLKYQVEKAGTCASHGGPSFFTTDRAGVYTLRRLVCPQLVRAVKDKHTESFQTVVRTFVALWTHFQPQLMVELGTIWTRLFIPMLRASGTSHGAKMQLLKAIPDVLATPQALVNLWDNYDNRVVWGGHYGRIRFFRSLILVLVETCTNDPEEEVQTSPTKITGGAEVVAMASCTPMSRVAIGEAEVVRMESLAAICHVLRMMAKWLLKSTPTEQLDTSWRGRFKALSKEDALNSAAVHIAQTKGIKKAVIHLKLQRPSAISHFTLPRLLGDFIWFNIEQLDPVEVGDFLSTLDDTKDFMTEAQYEIMRERFMTYVDMSGLSFDRAFRMFLCDCHFRLPGEAGKLGRLLEVFCNSFCHQRPGIFADPGCALVVAYALVMLNTELHDPRLKEDRRKKNREAMTMQQFCHNLRGTNNDKDHPRPMLEGLYKSIARAAVEWKADSLKLAQDRRSARDADKERQQEKKQLAEQARLQLRGVLLQLIKLGPSTHTLHVPNDPAIVQQMFSSDWVLMVEAITHCGQTQNTNVLNTCILGLKDAVKLAVACNLPDAEEQCRSGLATLENVLKLQYIKAGMLACGLMKTCRYRLKAYPKSVAGKTLIDWLIKEHHVEERAAGIKVGNALFECGLECAIGGETIFKDSRMLYLFNTGIAKRAVKRPATPLVQQHREGVRQSIRHLNFSSSALMPDVDLGAKPSSATPAKKRNKGAKKSSRKARTRPGKPK